MTAPDTPATPGGPHFDSALRGYDRGQVDEWTTAAAPERVISAVSARS